MTNGLEFHYSILIPNSIKFANYSDKYLEIDKIEIHLRQAMKPDLIAIVGPTACGKTKRAVQLATAIDAEIISGDSRQVYRNMDIGTGKDLSEYGNIKYHIILMRL